MTNSGIGLRAWGWREPEAPDLTAGAVLGRVVQVDRGECDVITEEGQVRALSDSARSQAETAPVTGDWVELTETGDASAISRVRPRCTTLERRDPAERDTVQVLASNFDIVGIVAGLDRPLPPGRFERLLVMARDSAASIVVLLTKVDLADAEGTAALVAAEQVRAISGDTAVLAVSAVSGEGIGELRDVIGLGRTMVLVGASGSGKSTLVNALAGEEVVATAEVRASDRRGRHTTVARRLVLLPGDGGLVLDTPGLRSLGLLDTEDALHEVFGDVDTLSDECRFSDCAHRSEPDCAVTAAVADGRLDARRLQRFLDLCDEIALLLQRETERARSSGRSRR